MATGVRVPVNPATVMWARDALQVGPEVVAKYVGIKTSALEAIEQGETQPTYAQAKKLARKLERSLAFLMGPPPAEIDVPHAVDFRSKGADEVPAALHRELKRCADYRDAMVDLGEVRPVARVQPVTWKNYEQRATEFRTAVGINERFVPPRGSDNREVFNFWRDLVEGSGYLVFQATGIDLDAFKGLSADHERIPVLLLNGADYPASKVFTLFHEICHLANRQNGLCLLQEQVNPEALANRFSAAVLMPEAQLKEMRLDACDPDEASLEVAKKFRVSRLSAAIRLKHLGFMTEEALQALWIADAAEWRETRRQEREARAKRAVDRFSTWILKYRDLGPRYVGALARAYEDDRLNMIDLTYLMNTRIPTVEYVLNAYYQSGGDAE